MFAMLLQLAIAVNEPQIDIPAFTAYIEPNPEGAEVAQDGITQWADPKQEAVWYGSFAGKGDVHATVTLQLPESDKARFKLLIGKKIAEAEVTGKKGEPVTLDFGAFPMAKAPGYASIRLKAISRSGSTFGRIISLRLDGPGTKGAHFNLTERRNAASVHLGYPFPKETKVAWFYNEVKADTDPVHTFYMACGFNRGYFGMQVNSPTERRVIFSVWDSGNEGIDRSKVKPDDRVKLLAKGANVVAGDFGNEGTGGHSHLVYPWKKGQTYRFLLTAEPEGDKTVYSGYFYFPEKQAWGLIASFRAPKDGGYLRGLHSFNENFWGVNGQLLRSAQFGPIWIRSDEGQWQELLTARFTHDGHGKENRKDYSACGASSHFVLANGGFVGTSIKLGDTVTRKPSGKEPKIELPKK